LADRFRAQGLLNVAQYHYYQAMLHYHAMNLEKERERINEKH